MAGFKINSIFLLLLVARISHGERHIHFSFRTEDPSYSIDIGNQQWFYSLDICIRNNYKLYCAEDGSLSLSSGRNGIKGVDAYGKFMSTTQTYSADGVSFTISARTYDDGKTLILEQFFPQGLNGTVIDRDDIVSSFPSLVAGDSREYSNFQDNPRGYLQFKGGMLGSGAKIGRWDGEGLNEVGSGLEDTGPIIVFTKNESVVISPASDFMSMNQRFNKTTGELAYGIMGSVLSIPPGFSCETIISYTHGGPRKAMEEWGTKLLNRYSKSREESFGDFTTNYLQYSTDNGAFYYYLTENNKTYEETIIDVKKYAESEGIPYRQWLMDSWWYFKGDKGGVKNWTAMPSVFPHGADYVYNETLWPIVAHNRYWDATTDYAKANGGDYDFIIEQKTSGNHGPMAIPTQQSFWDFLLSTSSKWGLRTYEQDWLYNEFSEMNCTLSSPTLARQWLMQMGNAASKNGLTIQYCMSWCRHMLQSIEIQAVTQARASGDYHPGNDQWNIGLSSILAHAIGVRPTKDNFWSTSGEKGRYHSDTEGYNRLQAAVSSFSTGPVAPSDMIGGSDAKLILKSCAADGKLLQPDLPAGKIDSSIYHDAGILPDGPDGEFWSTTSTISGHKYGYMLAINTKKSQVPIEDILGFADFEVYMWESNSTDVPLTRAGKIIQVPATDKSTFNVMNLAPVLENGYIFMGEATTKWVPVSGDRFRNIVAYPDSFYVEFTGAPGEHVVLSYAKSGQNPEHVTCTVTESGAMRFQIPSSIFPQTCMPL